MVVVMDVAHSWHRKNASFTGRLRRLNPWRTLSRVKGTQDTVN